MPEAQCERQRAGQRLRVWGCWWWCLLLPGWLAACCLAGCLFAAAAAGVVWAQHDRPVSAAAGPAAAFQVSQPSYPAVLQPPAHLVAAQQLLVLRSVAVLLLLMMLAEVLLLLLLPVLVLHPAVHSAARHQHLPGHQHELPPAAAAAVAAGCLQTIPAGDADLLGSAGALAASTAAADCRCSAAHSAEHACRHPERAWGSGDWQDKLHDSVSDICVRHRCTCSSSTARCAPTDAC